MDRMQDARDEAGAPRLDTAAAEPALDADLPALRRFVDIGLDQIARGETIDQATLRRSFGLN